MAVAAIMGGDVALASSRPGDLFPLEREAGTALRTLEETPPRRCAARQTAPSALSSQQGPTYKAVCVISTRPFTTR